MEKDVSSYISSLTIVTRNLFEFKYVIGKGVFGKVWKVIEKKTNTTYALKEMQKLKVIAKHSEKSIKYERELLSRMKHPFIVNMIYSFQDYDNLYLILDYLDGGDLRYHICKMRRFTEEQASIFIFNNHNRILYRVYYIRTRVHSFKEYYT